VTFPADSSSANAKTTLSADSGATMISMVLKEHYPSQPLKIQQIQQNPRSSTSIGIPIDGSGKITLTSLYELS
jgi:hypothetical protein